MKPLMWPFRNWKRGQVLQSTMILMVILAGAAGISSMVYFQSKTAQRKRQDVEFGIQIQSGVETMLMAYRLAETRYITAISNANCNTANPFLAALKEGHQCTGGTPGVISVFTGTDAGTTNNIYSYVNACNINVNSSDCASTLKEIVSVGINDVAQKFQGSTFRFFINAALPEKSIAEMVLIIQPDGYPKELKRSFAIRPALPNAAHLEADGRVVQENPDPLARCPGSAFANFLYFHPVDQNCQRFQQLGSGTGLAYYQGRYFGFRPFDGQVIDMLLASDDSSPSYLVNESGTVGSAPEVIFPPYNKAALINVDDLTLIGDQIFYVALGAGSGHIGALIGTDRLKICKLGTLNWSQSNSGIAALGWSDPLVTEDLTATNRLAVFFVKSDGGDLFTAVVRRTINTQPPTEAQFTCSVFKDRNLQQIEYKRTLAFDRTSDSKPYYIY